MEATGKEEILSELLQTLVSADRVRDPSVALADLVARERNMTTAIQNGVAIPHAKTEGVESLSVCVGIHPQGVDFRSLDGQPTHIFVMILTPVALPDRHLDLLREVGQIIRSPGTLRQLSGAADADQVLSVFGL